MKGQNKGILLVNLAALFISTSGILGKLIPLPPMVTSFYRCVLASIFLSLFVFIARKPSTKSWKLPTPTHGLSGLFLALHWSTYFYALQLSNVSIAIIALFTHPILATLVEPLFSRAPISGLSVVNSMIVVIGIIILVPDFDLSNDYTLGLLIGLLSAFFYALRNIMSKQLITSNSGEGIMIIQLMVAAIVLSPSPLLQSYSLSLNTWGLLILLSLVTTALGHTLFVFSLKSLSASTASIISSLQPVYAIVLAVLIIDEKVTPNVLIGGGLIILAVLFQSLYPQLTHKKVE